MDNVEAVGHDNEATAWLVSELDDKGIDVSFTVNGSCENLHVKLRRHGLQRLQVIFGVRGRLRIEHHTNPRHARRNLLEQFQPLLDQRCFKIDKAGDVATRTRQAFDKTAADRIGDDYEDKRDGLGLAMQRGSHRRGVGQDHLWLQRYQLFRKLPRPINVPRSPTVVDAKVAVLEPSKGCKFLFERTKQVLRSRVVLVVAHQHANPLHPVWLLRAGGKRPCRRTADKRDEHPPPHCASEENASANARNLAPCEGTASAKWRPT